MKISLSVSERKGSKVPEKWRTPKQTTDIQWRAQRSRAVNLGGAQRRRSEGAGVLWASGVLRPDPPGLPSRKRASAWINC